MSPAPIRRAPTAAPPPVEGINFGALNAYSGGFTLPEGDYALEFEACMETLTEKQSNRQPRLGVLITAHPLDGGEAVPQFLSMGGKAHLSFAPNPDTGKGFVQIPGGAGASLNNKTNWFIFLKSLYDSGMPEGTLINDFTAIDGVWVHTQQIPEPEDRKGFGGAKTGEMEEQRTPGMIPVVTEIKEGGKPWEGTGGIGVAPAPVKAGPKAVAKPGAKKAAPAPVVEAAEVTDETILDAAVQGITAVLEKSPAGCTRLLLRTQTFTAVQKAAGDDMAQAVIDTFFGSDAALNGPLAQLGYTVVGSSIKPAA